ncbi:MAG TPA: molybdopterin-guanine dinucleotide biosynthesis protein B [Gemmatimonadales bacterium]|nr:molybdopterin-guanine dinucleotide biosynthesis protein B [Gemmatimonadales bacterium]
MIRSRIRRGGAKASAAVNGVPVVGFVGSSGSGKTTLITAVLPLLMECGRRVGVVKHARHGFDLDRPGKDSHRLREAGATQVMVASRERWALMTETLAAGPEPPFRSLLQQFDPQLVDLVLAEGFAGEPYPKIEVYRPERGNPPKCWPTDPWVVAVATDVLVAVSPPVVRLDLNRPFAIATYILEQFPANLGPTAVRHAD